MSITATFDTNDFSALSVPLTFASGSTGGAELCSSVTPYSDNVVESEETFLVRLIHTSPKGSFFSLGNSEITMYLIDSDCKYSQVP
jgi:hypothetical protein